MTRWQAKLNDAEKRKAVLSRNQAIREQWLHGDALEPGRHRVKDQPAKRKGSHRSILTLVLSYLRLQD